MREARRAGVDLTRPDCPIGSSRDETTRRGEHRAAAPPVPTAAFTLAEAVADLVLEAFDPVRAAPADDDIPLLVVHRGLLTDIP